ncbi:MAG: hypothetical protein E1N59_486 [Puniceicoccaceae bacterium 5H]|nr:MAG: hypothetical protein E1N59_486 [Puniceicoccaceae bacterium 5H]
MKNAPSSTFSKAYGSTILTLVVAIVVVAGIGGLGQLWLQQQRGEMIRRTEEAQQQITQVERKLRYLDSEIARVHRPDNLQNRAVELGLNLRPPTSGQIVYLSREPLPDEVDNDVPNLFAQLPDAPAAWGATGVASR